MSSSPKCHHRLKSIIAQMSSSPNCHHRSTAIIVLLSSQPKCLHRPNVFIAQMSSSPKCHHRPNVFISQMLTSPQCLHRSNVAIAQMSSIFIFALWTLYGASMWLTIILPTHLPCYFSVYTLTFHLDIPSCIKLDESCNQQQKCWIILSKLRLSGYM